MTKYLDQPPLSETITEYDRQCFKLYLMLIDADQFGARWHEAYEWAFGEEVGKDVEKAEARYASHLKRAKWLSAKIGQLGCSRGNRITI